MSIQANFPAIKPSLLLDFANTKQLDNRITFTRSTPAVYYDGRTTAVAEQNLLLRSQDWSASWGLNTSATTVTANSTTAPDGTNTATQFSIASTTNLLHYSEQSVLNTTGFVTVSCYFKANTQNYLNLAVYQSGFGYAYSIAFDLSTGAITKNTTIGSVTNISSSITSVGSGWYRVTVTANFPPSLSTYLIFSTNSVSVPTYNYQGIVETYAGTIGQSFYVWGAQLEKRNAATAYTATTTQPITNYIPVLLSAGGNQPRFDCNPTTGESLGLLIEEQRTNLATYSEQFGSWSVSGFVVAAPSILPNQVIAPDGTLTGDQITLPAVSGVGAFTVIYFPFTASAATYTGSFYLKGKNGGEVVWINFTKNGVTYTQTLCTLTTSWQRFTLTSTLTAGGDNFQIGVDLRDSAESAKPAQTFFIWGGQLEQGAFPTSYIATTSASATRTADNASMTGTNFSSWYNQAQGTIYADATTYMDVTNTANRTDTVTISEGTASTNSMLFGVNTVGSSNVMYLYTLANGSPQVDLQLALTSGSYKTSYAYKVNDFALCLNGSSASTDGSGILSYSVNQMWIGSRFNSGQHQNGTIKKIAYYPIRVTNAQLQALTS